MTSLGFSEIGFSPWASRTWSEIKRKTKKVKESSESKHVLWNLAAFSVTFIQSMKGRGGGGVIRSSLTYFASAQPLFGDHILPSPISPRARWERGARSPLAPTVPFSGTKERQEASQRKASESVSLFQSIEFKLQNR